MYAAKALYAMVMAALTAALAIWSDNVYLIVAAAALVPLGVYLVPNTTDTVAQGGELPRRDPLV